MRVTKRIEAYIHDEVSKIAEVKREAIRAKYNESMNEFKAFCESIEKECELLNQQINKIAETKGYKIRPYYERRYIQSNAGCFYNPVETQMNSELSAVNRWVDDQTNQICVKLEMGGDMETLGRLLDELRKSL